MKQREQWRPVLEAEMKRWSAMSSAQLASQLADVRTYEVEFDSKKYQVEVQILENTVATSTWALPSMMGTSGEPCAPFPLALFAGKMAQSDGWRNIYYAQNPQCIMKERPA